MSQTKHKIFKIKISDDGKLTISKTVEKKVNDFLTEPNIVYVNHSVTILTEDVEEYDNLKTICKYVLISIVYKDLDSSQFNVKTSSKKIKSIVHKQIESGEKIEEPNILTEIDNEINTFINNEKKEDTPASKV